jgi:EAL domain-containing protein (putative c-di-GMP-specific phosphodiesterase class I)
MLEAETEVADRLTFEVTDSSAFGDLYLANTAIQRIRQRGFDVCLDDFGAGGASLASLRALSVDSVKIDGQCVQEVAQSGRDSALVRHLSQLCEELGVATIAEMVETAQAAGALAGIGVKLGQGFYFGRPTPEPVYQPPSTLRSRRAGEVDSWR